MLKKACVEEIAVSRIDFVVALFRRSTRESVPGAIQKELDELQCWLEARFMEVFEDVQIADELLGRLERATVGLLKPPD